MLMADHKHMTVIEMNCHGVASTDGCVSANL